MLLSALRDSVPAVRAEAANAIAQSLRRGAGEPASDSTKLGTHEAAMVLANALEHDRRPLGGGRAGQSLGRLPLPDTAAARTAEDDSCAVRGGPPIAGLAHGLYTLARARRATGNLTDSSVVLLRGAAAAPGHGGAPARAADPRRRRGGLDSAAAVRAMRDPDDETRRMALRGAEPALRPAQAPADRGAVVRAPSSRPRSRQPRGWVTARPIAGRCSRSRATASSTSRSRRWTRWAVAARNPAGAVAVLRRLVRDGRHAPAPADHRWQMGAHALLALARLDTTGLGGLLRKLAARSAPR